MSKFVPIHHRNRFGNDPYADLMEDFFDNYWYPMKLPKSDTFRLDIKEDETSYKIEAELPGVRRKDISVDLDEGRLAIVVAERVIKEGDKKRFLHKERCCGCMERILYLSDAAKSGAKAKLENGELIITVPKKKKR